MLFNNVSTDPGPEGEADRSDEQIRTEIEEMYSHHDYLKEDHIQVKVADCVVTLEGSVHTQQSWQLASDLAVDVRGVREVKNHIKINAGPGDPNK